MSNYSKTTDFEAKDSLPTGDSGKIIRGAEFETEFDAISTAIATKADTAGPTFTGTLTFETISDGTIGVTAFVDEDNMASNSATLVPTQQSVKAYVDSQVGANNELSEILANGNTTGGTNIVFGDSASVSDDRLVFGAGSDLQIYHSGVHSYIDDAGTGNLTLRGNASVRVEKYEGEILADFAADGAVSLYHDNSVKIATTSTGVNVTGNVAVSGTVDGRDVATDGTKLDGIEAGATADQTAAEIRTLVEAATDSNVFTDADHSKLDGIEALADVTDTTNVTAAGALMDSELTNITAVKALDQGVATTDTPTFAGLATTADVSFGDNDKAVFGAGSDLQIYHDGSTSIIKDAGTGELQLHAENNLRLQNLTGSTYALFSNGAASSLYYNGSAKLATTTTGIDVTGTVLSDGLRFGTATDHTIKWGSGAEILGVGSADQSVHIRLDPSDASNFGYFQVTDGSSDKALLYVDDNGDISFYEDTGTTAKLFWDASAESLGIGTASPVADSGYSSVTLDGSTGSQLFLRGAGTDRGLVWASSNFNIEAKSTTPMVFRTNSTERMRIDASGNVGIGTSSPSNTLSVNGNMDITGTIALENSTGYGLRDNRDNLFLTTSADTAASNRTLTFGNATYGQTILTGGKVGIGTSSPSNLLTISDATTAKLELNRNGTIGNGWIVSTDSAANEEVAIQMYNSEFRLYNNSTQNFTVTSGGNVGIGTNSPTNVSNYNSISVDGTTGSLIDSYYGGTLGGRIQAYSSKYLISAQGASLPLALGTNNTERMRIDASGNLLVGTTSTSLPATDAFVFLNNGEFRAGNDATSGGSNVELNRENSDGDFIRFYRAGSEVGSIGAKSSALVIGTEDTALRFFDSVDKIYPATTDGSIRDALIGLGNSNARFTDLYLSGRANLSNGSYVTFGDISTAIYGSNSLNLLTFTTNSSEKMRLDGSGNLLVGTTDSAPGAGDTNTGISFRSGGDGFFSKASSYAARFNRNTDDGDLVTFAKNGANVGSIQSRAGVVSTIILDPRSGQGAGLTGAGAGGDTLRHITPTNESGVEVNGKVSLGNSNNGFKDLYLSGGVVFGATGGNVSSKTLDDYEEGTWTPTVTTVSGFTVGASPSYSGTYVKVGKKVFIAARLDFDASENIAVSDFVQLGGMPFTPVHAFDGEGVFHVAVNASSDRGATGLAYNIGSSLYLWTTHIGSGAQQWSSAVYVQMAFEVS